MCQSPKALPVDSEAHHGKKVMRSGFNFLSAFSPSMSRVEINIAEVQRTVFLHSQSCFALFSFLKATLIKCSPQSMTANLIRLKARWQLNAPTSSQCIGKTQMPSSLSIWNPLGGPPRWRWWSGIPIASFVCVKVKLSDVNEKAICYIAIGSKTIER